VDEESGAVVWELSDPGRMADFGYSAAGGIAAIGLGILDLRGEAGAFVHGWVDAGSGLAAQSLAVLCAGGEVEFPGFGVRDFAAGAAAFRRFAVPELVSKPGFASGGVEGADVSGLTFWGRVPVFGLRMTGWATLFVESLTLFA
jgi:hypothetical protein